MSKEKAQADPEAVARINESLQKIDFTGFWERVLIQTIPEIDALERARRRSRESAATHVLD